VDSAAYPNLSPMRLLLTTTSFQETPGSHHALLEETGFEVVRARGPLTEEELLPLLREVDACLCGDDAFTRRVLEAARPRLRFISKYGIGLDRIDLAACTDLGIPVFFTPGVNAATVAEHVFLLILALERHVIAHTDSTRRGGWDRQTGGELAGKRLGILGFGNVAREVARLGSAFGMRLLAHGNHWDRVAAEQHGVTRISTREALFQAADILTLNTRLDDRTRGIVDARAIGLMQRGVRIVNCARGALVNVPDLVAALESGQVGGYAADVLEAEPPPPDHPLPRHPRCLITPHIASRTRENVVRQATAAVENLILAMNGEQPHAQANPEVPLPRPFRLESSTP